MITDEYQIIFNDKQRINFDGDEHDLDRGDYCWFFYQLSFENK